MQEKHDEKPKGATKPHKPWAKRIRKWRGPTGIFRMGCKAARYFYLVQEEMEKKKGRRVESSDVFDEIFSNRLRVDDSIIYRKIESEE